MLRLTGYAKFYPQLSGRKKGRSIREHNKYFVACGKAKELDKVIRQEQFVFLLELCHRLCIMKAFNVIHEKSSKCRRQNVKEFPIQAEVEIRMR